MYWSPKLKTAAAHMLIERHKGEITHLIETYGGQIALESRFAGKLRSWQTTSVQFKQDRLKVHT